MIKISFILFLVVGCQQSESPEQVVTPESIIATYKGGHVKLQQIEDYIIKLPANARWAESQADEWLRGIINKVITHEKFLEEALLIAADQEPKYKDMVHNIMRNAYSQQYLEGFDKDNGLVEEDLKAYYKNNIDQYVLPEKRYVYHIYKSKSNNNQAKSQLQSLRKRAIQGENFKLLAEEFSDSETRHNNGLLGILQKGNMSKDFDSVVFALEKNTPSEVISTVDGYHLFFVSDILQAKTYEYSQVKNIIKKELIENHAINNLKEKALLLPVPAPFEQLAYAELMQINLSKNPRKVILRVGDYELTIGQYMYELNEARKKYKQNLSKDFPEKLLENIAYTEIIYQHMNSQSIILHQDKLIRAHKERLLVSEYTNTRLRAYLNNNTHIITDYFEKNRMRFASLAKVNIQRLLIPKLENGNIMSILESNIEELDSKKLTFEQLAQTYNGRIQSLGWKNSAQLASIDPKILKYAFVLNEDEHSPPYTNKSFYSILKLIKRKEPVEQPLAVVREQVINEYIKNHSAEIYTEISKDLLKDVKINDVVLTVFINQQGIKF